MLENEARPPQSLKGKIIEAWQKFKYDVTGNHKHLKPKHPKHRVRIVLPSPPRVRVASEQIPPGHSLVDPIENVHAADAFIEAIRNPRRYQYYDTGGGIVYRSNELGLELDPSTGYFNAASVLKAALERYTLPLVIYIGSDRHARLAVGPPESDRRRGIINIPVYDPMIGNITRVEHPQSIALNGALLPNALAKSQLSTGKYDITFLDDPSLSRYKDSFLLSGKFSALQRDGKNCIPYCLFVGAMLEALKPGESNFKSEGISQFQKDFGVRILKREEITKVSIRPVS